MTAWDDVAAVAKPVVDLLEGKYLAADAKATLLTSELAAANQTAATLGLQLTDVNLQLAAVQKQLKDLQSQTPPTTPVPPVPTYKAKFGTGGGNSDRTAEKMSMDRRYYNSTQTASCITATKKNQAAGIITWSTFKVPNNDWAGAVAGKYDAWFTDLMAKLKALDYETWVDVHHEPEGDGDLTAWRGMQDRYSRMVPAGSKIKFWLCVTGYAQEYTDTSWWDKYYPTSAPIYGIAYDNPYLRYGKRLVDESGGKAGTLDTSFTEAKAAWIDRLVARAAKYKVKAAIGEMGYSDEAFTKDKAWLDRTFAACVAGKIEAICYFDSTLNSTRSWTLGKKGTPKRDYFDATVKKYIA